MVQQSEELGVVVKPDGRLKRRLRTRKVHREREGVVALLASQATTTLFRSKKVRKRRNSRSVLGAEVMALHGKAKRLKKRFHAHATLPDIGNRSESDNNGGGE